MAFSCFAAPKSKLTEGAHACLTAVVEKVGEIYRGPAKCLLINDAGELEFESDYGSPTTMQFDMMTLENLCVLKRASLQMADGLSSASGGGGGGRGGGGSGGSGSTPAMHLKSDGNVVSCFDAGDRHVFVVVAEMHTSSVELLDTSVGPGGVDMRLRDCLAALAAVL